MPRVPTKDEKEIMAANTARLEILVEIAKAFALTKADISRQLGSHPQTVGSWTFRGTSLTTDIDKIAEIIFDTIAMRFAILNQVMNGDDVFLDGKLRVMLSKKIARICADLTTTCAETIEQDKLAKVNRWSAIEKLREYGTSKERATKIVDDVIELEPVAGWGSEGMPAE